MVLASRWKRWLESRRLPAMCVLVACMLSLPSLRLGLIADDLWHRAMIRHDARWIPVASGPLELFTFADGSELETSRIVERGFAPWWTVPGLRISFFRPLASLTHALDYTLWPSSPVLMHAESIAWYGAVVFLAARLYRRWLGAISPLAAGVAAVFYTLDPAHGLPVGWIANRNALIATTFVLTTLLLHDSGSRRERPGAFPFLTAASLGLALCSGEGALAAVPWLLAHAWFLDERERGVRLRALAPSGAVLLLWIAVYRAGHFGVTGSGVYTDPLRSPGDYVAHLVLHLPLLLGTELGGPQPDAYAFLPDSLKPGFVSIAVFFVVWSAIVIVRLIQSPDDRVRRISRCLACASVLSLLPSAATFPSARLLFVAGFGLVGLLALVCAGLAEKRRVVRAYTAWTWLGHLVLAPFLFVFSVHSPAIFDGFIQRLATGIPADGADTSKRLVLVNAPDTAFAYYMIIQHIEAGRSPPERMLMMAGNARGLRLERTSDRSFLVHEEGGFYRSGTELLFRDVRPPLPAGSTIVLSDVTITVTHALPDGIPDEASFVLANAPEAGYVFREWKDDAMIPFTLPRIGETVTFPGRPTVRF